MVLFPCCVFVGECVRDGESNCAETFLQKLKWEIENVMAEIQDFESAEEK